MAGKDEHVTQGPSSPVRIDHPPVHTTVGAVRDNHSDMKLANRRLTSEPFAYFLQAVQHSGTHKLPPDIFCQCFKNMIFVLLIQCDQKVPDDNLARRVATIFWRLNDLKASLLLLVNHDMSWKEKIESGVRIPLALFGVSSGSACHGGDPPYRPRRRRSCGRVRNA